MHLPQPLRNDRGLARLRTLAAAGLQDLEAGGLIRGSLIHARPRSKRRVPLGADGCPGRPGWGLIALLPRVTARAARGGANGPLGLGASPGAWEVPRARRSAIAGLCAPSHTAKWLLPSCTSMSTPATSSVSRFERRGLEIAARALARLAGRLEALGYPVGDVESATGLPALWLDRGAANRPAAVLSTQLDEAAFGEALDVVCKLAARRPLSLLAYGAPRQLPGALRLRERDLALVLHEPLDLCALRFQVNRALAPVDAPPRGAPRAPIDMEVFLRVGWKTRPVRVYTLSSRGAFLLMEQPLRPGRWVELEVPAGGTHRPRAAGRVTFANSVHAPSHPELPPGVAVRFYRIDAIAACSIDHLVAKQLAAFAAA